MNYNELKEKVIVYLITEEISEQTIQFDEDCQDCKNVYDLFRLCEKYLKNKFGIGAIKPSHIRPLAMIFNLDVWYFMKLLFPKSILYLCFIDLDDPQYINTWLLNDQKVSNFFNEETT